MVVGCGQQGAVRGGRKEVAGQAPSVHPFVCPLVNSDHKKAVREERLRDGGMKRGDEVKGGEGGRGKKSMHSVSINVASGGLMAALNWLNRIVYLEAVIP